MRVSIKPMSVNEAWQGRRFKTKQYRRYASDVAKLLPAATVPEGEFSITLEFGLSSKLADWDNPVKSFVDILQTRYGFDDRRIVSAFVNKTLVPEGQEYIHFEFYKNLAVVAT